MKPVPILTRAGGTRIITRKTGILIGEVTSFF